jgi:spore germination cell wall hydrolase CwlJ-like protein
MPTTDGDLLTLARTIYGEARGESFLGQQAVGWVVVNRAKRPGWWGRTVAQVCLAAGQFSCWNSSDPNCALVRSIQLPDPAYASALHAALTVLAVQVKDMTHGACHYHADHVRPYWIKGKVPCIVIGHHWFYNDIS